MGTTDTRLNVSRNRILGRQDLDERFLGYVRGLVLEGIKNTFLVDTVFQTPLTLAADGDDKFKITGGAIATDGDGHMLNIAASGFANQIQFENTSAQDYDVGLRFADPFKGIQINPRNGLNEYVEVEEVIGDSADPDSVVDNGNSTITLVVDSVAEAGVTNAGRVVRVFLKVPAKNATTEAVAIEDLVVVFVGGLNKITTTGDLGQPTISTVAADYTVVLLGPTVRQIEDLQAAADTVFVGVVTGVGLGSPPTSFNTGGQRVFDFSFGDMADITRREVSTARLKIDVKSFAGDEDTNQIQVQDIAAGIVFSVDGTGKAELKRLLFAPAGTDAALLIEASTAAAAATGTGVVGADVKAIANHTTGSQTVVTGLVAEGEFISTSGAPVVRLMGVEALTTHTGVAAITDMVGFGVFSLIGSAINKIGLDIGDVTSGTNNFAIRTKLGLVQFGDETQVQRLLFTPTALTNALTVNASTAAAAAPGFGFRGASVQADSKHTSGGSSLNTTGLVVSGFHTGAGDLLNLVGLQTAANNQGGAVDTVTGILVSTAIGGTTRTIGVDIADVTTGGSTFALRTGLGTVEFGDDVVVVANVIPDLTLASDLGTNSLKWNEGHTRFLSIGSAAGVTFPDEDKALQVGIEDVTPTVTANAIRSFVTTSTADPSGTTIIGIDNFVTANHSTGTLANAIAALLTANNAGAGTVTSLVGLQIVTAGTGPVGTALGIDIKDVIAGTTNFALRTAAGLVRFGDVVEFMDVAQPDTLGVDLGATGSNRWQNVFCEQIRASDTPMGVVFEQVVHTFPTTWATAVIASVKFIRGGITQSSGVFTVPDDGIYWVSYTVPFTDASPPPTTTPTIVQARILVAGSAVPEQSLSQAGITDANQRDAIVNSFPVALVAGQTVALQLQHRNVPDGVPTNTAQYPNTDSGLLASLSFSIMAVSVTN